MEIFKKILAHPLTKGVSLDDDEIITKRRKIVEKNKFLRSIYSEWYEKILSALPEKSRVLELGSGAGFFSEKLGGLITSEIVSVPGVDLIVDARNIPFTDGSLDAIVMTDVFHHISDVNAFLCEATRCLRPGGRVVMVEPWKTKWSEFIYKNFHHEPFLPNAKTWDFDEGGALSMANGALPWMVFERDRIIFKKLFPRLRIISIKPFMPIAYLVSGGVSLRGLVPGFFYPWVRLLEHALAEERFAMFALIVVERDRPDLKVKKPELFGNTL
jgi:SAM-dependent methyltransferase